MYIEVLDIKTTIWFQSLTSSHRDVFGGDRVVRVVYEGVDRERSALPELGGDEQTHGPQQLQLRLADADARQEAVHVRHGQGEEDVFGPLLLAHLYDIKGVVGIHLKI